MVQNMISGSFFIVRVVRTYATGRTAMMAIAIISSAAVRE